MKAQPITSRIKPNAESNYQSRRRFPRAIAALVLALTILASLSFARSSNAVPLRFTLTGLTFNDGATASGFFILNPSTMTFGAFDITTTTSGSNTGSTYSSMAGTGTFYLSSPDAFIFDNFGIDDHYLSLAYSGHITGPGMYALTPGTPNGPGSFLDSGEYVNADFSSINYRLVTTGFLTVTALSVPETGGTLLSLSIGVAVLGLVQFGLKRKEHA